MKTLHLTLHRRWFDQIAAGVKKIEYREIKPYWTTRLEGKHFDEIRFRNGYCPDAPFIRAEFGGLTKNTFYQIHIGKVLEIRR